MIWKRRKAARVSKSTGIKWNAEGCGSVLLCGRGFHVRKKSFRRELSKGTSDRRFEEWWGRPECVLWHTWPLALPVLANSHSCPLLAAPSYLWGLLRELARALNSATEQGSAICLQDWRCFHVKLFGPECPYWLLAASLLSQRAMYRRNW